MFKLIEPFAGYAFNKAHSVSYAYIAYQTAYFKANYPIEYMTSLLNAHLGSQDRAGADAEECRALGITVAPPSVNASTEEFSIGEPGDFVDDSERGDAVIHVGLSAIKNVGYGAAQALVTERKENGPFKDLGDFIGRADLTSLNRRGLENLIKAGAMDGLGERAILLENVERILSSATQQQRQRNSSQSSMFDSMAGDPALELASIELAPMEPASDEAKGVWEKELMGIHFSDDPYRVLRAANLPADCRPCETVSVEMEKATIHVAGIITAVRPFPVRDKSAMSVTLNDQSGSATVTIWPEQYEKSMDVWQINTPVLVKGTVRVRQDEPSVICNEFTVLEVSSEALEAAPPPPLPVNGNGSGPKVEEVAEDIEPVAAVAEPTPDTVFDEPASEPPAPTETAPTPAQSSTGTNGANGTNGDGGPSRRIMVVIHETADEANDMEMLNQVVTILRSHPGGDSVRLVIREQDESTEMDLPLQADYTEELQSEIRELLGESSITAQTALL